MGAVIEVRQAPRSQVPCNTPPSRHSLGINCCFISQSARRHRQEKFGSAAAVSATRSRFLPFEVRNRFAASLAERRFHTFDGMPDKQAQAQNQKKGVLAISNN